MRGGGHSIPGLSVCEDGMLVDLQPMKSIEVDPHRRVATAEAGVVWAQLDDATQEHGLAVTGGEVSDTGIAGLTVGGGLGWLKRTCGLTRDNLLAAEVVTADGRIVRASERDNAEPFWVLRGGGGTSASSPASPTGCTRSADAVRRRGRPPRRADGRRPAVPARALAARARRSQPHGRSSWPRWRRNSRPHCTVGR